MSESNSLLLALQLSAAPAVFSNFNTRTEKSGPDEVPAADLEFTVNQSADVLAFFSPTLKSYLFDEKSLDLAEGMALRYPNLHYPLSFDREMTGATVKIETGVGKPMEFADVKVNKIRITPMTGGAVQLQIRVQCKPDEKQAGRLYMMQGSKTITLSIDPAELATMGGNE